MRPGTLPAAGKWLALLGGSMASLAGAAEFEGHVDVGLREVSLSGDESKYRQHVNLDDGARIFGLSLRFAPSKEAGHVPDLIELNASGLGGDPYQNIDLQIREYGGYQFKYSRRQSDYFYDDLLIDPTAASIEKSTGGDFHKFDFERVRDSVSLDINLSDRAKLALEYDRYEKTGDSTTVYDIEREEFELDQPIDELHQSYAASLEYAWDKVSVVWTERLREYENASSVLLPGFSSGSDPEAPTELDFFFLDQPYELDSFEHQLRIKARPTRRFDVLFAALVTDTDLYLQTQERTQGLDYLGVPFVTDVAGSGDADRDTEHYHLALGYRLHERVRVIASGRRNTLDQTSTLRAGPSQGDGAWKMRSNGFETGVELAIIRGLNLSAGWVTESRDTEFVQESADFLDAADVKTTRDGYYFDLAYRPDARLTLGLSFEDDSIDDPFTLASPTDSQRLRVHGRYRWPNGTSVSASYRYRELENERSGWDSRNGQATVRLTHTATNWQIALGASWIDLNREIEQRVVGGFRQDLFAIEYAADASYVDGSVRWNAAERLTFGGSFRSYDNDGSFEAERDEVSAFAEFALPRHYSVELGYRNVDFAEEDLESFDADIWEVKLRLRW